MVSKDQSSPAELVVGLTLVSFCRYRLRRVKGLGQEMIAKGMVKAIDTK